MKRHHVPTTTSIGSGNEDGALESVAKQSTTASTENTTKQRVDLTPGAARPSPSGPGGSAARPNATHTLVLVGELNRASTHTVEAEIERLYEGGIKAIILDLRQLSGIDSAGVAVIVFRSRWCHKRGCELMLIPGPQAVQRAFELAGVADALPFKENDSATT